MLRGRPRLGRAGRPSASYNAGIIGRGAIRLTQKTQNRGAIGRHAQTSPPHFNSRSGSRRVGGGSRTRTPPLALSHFNAPHTPHAFGAGGSVGFASAGRGGSFLRSSRRA